MCKVKCNHMCYAHMGHPNNFVLSIEGRLLTTLCAFKRLCCFQANKKVCSQNTKLSTINYDDSDYIELNECGNKMWKTYVIGN